MIDQHTIEQVLNELKIQIEELNKKLVAEAKPKVEENSKQYQEIIELAGELNAKLSGW